MTAGRPPSDSALEAMLVRRAARAQPDGLLAEISSVVERTPQARPPILARLGLAAPFAKPLRLAWVVAVVGLLLALVVGLALIGARLAERPIAPFRYSGEIDTLSEGIDWWSARTDRAGNVWAYSPGHLARVDTVSGAIRSWSLSDHEAFASAGIAPAREGGVWLIGTGVLRRFDGNGFQTVIEDPDLAAGGEIWGLAEAPDGGLWAALGELGPRRWDGTSWAEVGESPAGLFATFVTVDRAGRVWAGGIGGGVSVYDGRSWATYPPSGNAAAAAGTIRFIADAPDGTIWVGTDSGVARLDGSAWTDLTSEITSAVTGEATDPTAPTSASPAGSGVVSIAFDSHGRPWVAYIADVGSSAQVRVAWWTGREWIAYGPDHGLPAGSYAAWITVSSEAVYLVASPGLFRLEGMTWQRVWPTTEEPGLIRHLLGVSRDEVWAAADDGIYRYRGEAWVRDDPGGPGSEGSGSYLALAPDGALWAAGYFGVAVRSGERWSVLAQPEFGGPIAFGPHANPYVAESHYPADRVQIDALTFVGGEWSPGSLGTPPIGWVSSLAVARDGAVWAGSDGFFAPSLKGLARFDGQSWERVRPPGAGDVAVTDILAGPDGDLWIALDGGQVARFDGTDWAVFGASDGLPALPGTLNVDLAAGPDGTIWAPTDDGLARFDGERWTVHQRGVPFGPLSVAPDGTVWAMGPSGVQRLRTADSAR